MKMVFSGRSTRSVRLIVAKISRNPLRLHVVLNVRVVSASRKRFNGFQKRERILNHFSLFDRLVSKERVKTKKKWEIKKNEKKKGSRVFRCFSIFDNSGKETSSGARATASSRPVLSSSERHVLNYTCHVGKPGFPRGAVQRYVGTDVYVGLAKCIQRARVRPRIGPGRRGGFNLFANRRRARV